MHFNCRIACHSLNQASVAKRIRWCSCWLRFFSSALALTAYNSSLWVYCWDCESWHICKYVSLRSQVYETYVYTYILYVCIYAPILHINLNVGNYLTLSFHFYCSAEVFFFFSLFFCHANANSMSFCAIVVAVIYCTQLISLFNEHFCVTKVLFSNVNFFLCYFFFCFFVSFGIMLFCFILVCFIGFFRFFGFHLGNGKFALAA